MRWVLPFSLTAGSIIAAGCVEAPPRHYYVEQRVMVAPPPAPPPAAVVVTEYEAPEVRTLDIVAGPEVEVGEFHEQLSPYGRWVDVDQFGECWVPNSVEAGWRPYSVGYWVHSSYGWTWVSEERFGYATYHYGRWLPSEQYGWVWVPGRTWGPAWVAWRSGNGYCGWAPLPPRRGPEVVVFTSAEVEVLPADRFVFCGVGYMGSIHCRDHFEPRERNVTIINRTTNITNITIVNNRVVNRGVPMRDVERLSGHKIQNVNVHSAPSLVAVRTAHERELTHDLAHDERAAKWDEEHARHVEARDNHVAEHDAHVAQKDAVHDQHIAAEQASHEEHVAHREAEQNQRVNERDAARAKELEERNAQLAAKDAARAKRLADERAAEQKRVDEREAARAKHVEQKDEQAAAREAEQARHVADEKAAEQKRVNEREAARAKHAADIEAARAKHAAEVDAAKAKRDADKAARDQRAADKAAAQKAKQDKQHGQQGQQGQDPNAPPH